jgi:hypothetical protein
MELDRIPPPTFSQTFSWLNQNEIYGEFGWMTSDEFATDVADDLDEPRAYLVETWERTEAEVRWAKPMPVTCDIDPEHDATMWVRLGDGSWSQRCDDHREGITDGG